MLEIKNVVKTYYMADESVQALKGISLKFRKKEFVSILGPSGCGKTTLLNIIGGLDRYTDGDLIINDVSTKHFIDGDWDAYRNHTIGFVFQSYNLITHQTVLANVELALTLSGISKEERKARAIEALTKVGLADQLKKKPNQLSGGQTQRVAIARAIVNNPDILLADEPTGALDSETSVQIMDILKELSQEKLVIMVTHNAELALSNSTRIIRILDGLLVDDTAPYAEDSHGEEIAQTESEGVTHSAPDADTGFAERESVSVFVDEEKPATGNSNAEQAVQRGTLSDGEAEAEAISVAPNAAWKKARRKANKKSFKGTSMSFSTALSLSLRNLLTKKTRTFLTSFAGSIGIIGIALVLSLSNGFTTYISKIEADTISASPIMIAEETIDMEVVSEMMNTAENFDLEKHTDEEIVHVNKIMASMITMTKTNVITDDYVENVIKKMDPSWYYSISYVKSVSLNVYTQRSGASGINYPSVETMGMWSELVDNQDFINSQYQVLKGRLPSAANEIILVVDAYNQITDLLLMSLGIINAPDTYTFDEILQWELKSLSNDEVYSFNPEQNRYVKKNVITASDYEKGMPLDIVGIVRLKGDTVSGSIMGNIGYTSALTDAIIEKAQTSDVVVDQREMPDYDILEGVSFASQAELSAITTTVEELYQDNLRTLSAQSTPVGINIYAKDFDTKELIKAYLDEYNATQESVTDKVYYTDYMELVMSAMTRIVNIVSYVLIAFTAISLVVSSIMIGIITYISVIERTKEIGILRSIGARKKDIARVFNAETVIVGFVAGLIGVLITALLTIPINLILKSLVDGIGNLAVLSPLHALILVIISVGLTLIAGLIPSGMAAKKDPVEALRTD